MTTDTFARIPLDQLHESEVNDRQVYDEAALQSLADDIARQGVLEPLLVRPRIPKIFAGDVEAAIGFEVVCGHRRLRASHLASVPDAPCVVRTMNDLEVKLAQFGENLQRENLNALEEAEGFRKLLEDHALGVDDIVARTGKSRSHVYGRLKLLTLNEKSRKAFLAGDMQIEIALLLARMPSEKLQLDALEKIQSPAYGYARNGLTDGGKSGYRATREFLLERYTTDLKGALFKLDDAGLVESAGACTACPKRSGCTPELFIDIVDSKENYRTHGANICTDPDCFAGKKKAQLKREQAALEAKGQVVVAGGVARNAIGADGKVRGAYVALKDSEGQLAKARQNAQKDSKVVPPQVVTIQDPRTGKTVKAVKVAELKAAGVKVVEPKAAGGRSPGQDEAARRHEEAALEKERSEATAANTRLFMAVRAEAAVRPMGVEELRLIALRVAGDALEGDDGDFLCNVWGLVGAGGKPMSPWAAREPFAKRLSNASPAQLTAYILDAIHAEGVEVSTWSNPDDKPAALLATAKRYGVDVKAIMAAVPTEAPAAQAPTRPAKGKSGLVKYANGATGETWSGRGLQPAWVKAALAAGCTLEDLAVEKSAPAAASAGVDAPASAPKSIRVVDGKVVQAKQPKKKAAAAVAAESVKKDAGAAGEQVKDDAGVAGEEQAASTAEVA